MLQKITQVFIMPLLREGRLKLIETIHHLIHLLMESLKSLFHLCVSYALVYDAVNLSKIVVISSTKPPSYPYV